MTQETIVVAGATGNLGFRIARALRLRDARVMALTRATTSAPAVEKLRALGVECAQVDITNVESVAAACRGASCVVSAVLGLREVMVDAQTVLLEGAVKAGVPRFIPSDYSLDFNQLRPGENRNLDLHREFQTRLDAAPIAATSILNGAFMELLLGQAPYILFKRGRIIYWQNPDQVLDFTALDNVGAFTAAAALDPKTPRFLKIVGEQITPRQLAVVAQEVTGRPFKLTWVGTVGMLGLMIRVAKALAPASNEPFPAWQGMQYSHNMFSGRGALKPIDNGRYPDLTWTTVRDLLRAR